MKRAVLFFVFLFALIMLRAQAREAGYLVLGEDSIFYEWAGSGPSLVLIHDGLLHREVWNDQFSSFSKDFKVISYDRRGYGASSAATGSYTHLADLKALFKQLEIENAVLIACSSGGALAIDFTLEYPQKVKALVLVGAVVGGFSYTGHMRDRGGHLPENFRNEFEEGVYYIMDDPYEIYEKNSEAKKRALDLFRKYPLRDNRRPAYVRPEIPSCRRLSEIAIPALILVGEFDIPDVHAHAGAINAGIRGSKRQIVRQSGHLVPLEQADAFNEIVLDFLMDNFN